MGFKWVVAIQNFRTNSRPKFFEMAEKYPDKQVFIFDTHEKADAWLDEIQSR